MPDTSQVDSLAILRAAIVDRCLVHHQSQVTGFSERRQQGFKEGLHWIEKHQHDFGVPATSGTNSVVGRILSDNACITRNGAEDAFKLAKQSLGTPEAT